MVSSFQKYDPTPTQEKDAMLRARVYGARSGKIAMAPVHAQTNRSQQTRPDMSHVMDFSAGQPYIHDARVVVFYGKKEYRFVLYFKNHKHLPSNHSIARLMKTSDEVWRGDVVVMKANENGRLVNYRSTPFLNGLDFTDA